MDDIKINNDIKKFKKTPDEKHDIIDTALFDKTLNQIEKVLENFDVKVSAKQNVNFKKKTREENISYGNEHTIDNSHLNMEELHSFSAVPMDIKKNSFGFYTYLAIAIGIIFLTYEILNVSKNSIILNYPIAEPYIEYFYEVIEILAYIFMNLVSFVKNLF